MLLRRRGALLILPALALAASPGWAQQAGGLDARIEQEVQRVMSWLANQVDRDG